MKKKLYAWLCCLCLLYPGTIMAAEELYVGGNSVGIEVAYDGVMITGTYAIDIDGTMYDPGKHDIKIGDIIESINQVAIHDMKELYQEVAKFTKEVNDVPIHIKRGDEPLDVTLKTLYHESDHTFQSGLYVKDKITGVGTMTFYDPLHKTFGALGHEIMDTDLKEIAQISTGTIYNANVTSIVKAQPDIAGEKHASIDYETPIGDIDRNTKIGIYGHYDTTPSSLLLPAASVDEVHTGPAQMYTALHGEEVQTFDIEITAAHKQDKSSIKGIEFRVSDPALLAAANGIVQGMSGSPIVQDGKIIGAITHVITSQPTTGYGVYIEWMLDEANKNE